jgi:hypothetical protein
MLNFGIMGIKDLELILFRSKKMATTLIVERVMEANRTFRGQWCRGTMK